MPRSHLFTGIALTLSVGALLLGAAVPASAAVPKVQVAVRAASSAAVVYAERAKTGKYLGETGSVHSVDREHGTIALTAFSANGELDLVGDVLSQPVTASGKAYPLSGVAHPITAVHWKNLSTHASGRVALSTGQELLASVSQGWVTRSAAAVVGDGFAEYDLHRLTTNGSSTDLGTPYPDGAEFTISEQASGLVAISSDPSDDGFADSDVKYMSWTSPGRWTTVYAPSDDTELYCPAASASTLWCTHDFAEHTVERVPVNGASTSTVKLTSAQFQFFRTRSAQTLRHSLIQEYPTTHLLRLTASGRIVRSTRTYTQAQTPVYGALGEIVVRSADKSKLLVLDGVKSKPKLLVTG